MHDRLRPATSAVPSRRKFLAGAAALSLLAACGDDDTASSGSNGGEGGTGEGGAGAGDGQDPQLSVVRFFGPYFVAGTTNRVPFGLADADGLLPVEDSPAELTVTVTDPDGNVVADSLTAPLRSEGLPRGYYAFEFTPESAGFHDFTMDVDGGEILSQLQVVAPDDPNLAGLVGPGDQMPALETPTVENPRGVTPICTREPPCDLHEVAVSEALDGGGPVVVLVATPAFCQTAVCGPVLDVMIDQMPDFPDVRFVHAEVFKDPENNSTPLAPEDYAPVIGALGLPFEPALYTVGADGVVRDRLDYIFDGTEINETVRRLV